MKHLFTLVLVAALFSMGRTAVLVSYRSSWKYLDNGTDQGTAWRTAAFSDATWASGNTELGFGDGDETTVVSYGADANNKYITTYFRKSVNITETYSSYTLNLIRDDGAVVYVNGSEVYRSNMPTGTVSFNTLATTAAGDDGSTQQTVIIPASAFVSGSNVIAVEIHQNIATSSDLSFDLQLIGNRSTVQALISWNSIWRYLDNGTDQGTAWIPAGFSDAAWAKGPGELGFGDADEATTVSYGPDANNKYITTYFRKTFRNPGGYSSYSLSLKRDDGVAVYVNGNEVWRNNLASGALFNTLATTATSDDGNVPQVVVIPSSSFVTGENTIAVEIHQSAVNSSDLSFDAELTGNSGNTQSLVDFGERWRYLDNGTDQGSAWIPVAFSDAAWSQGWAELGYGDADQVTTVSYGSNANDKYEVTYFRKTINLSSVTAFKGYTLRTFRDDGLVVYVNGSEVWRNNMPYGTVSFTTLADAASPDDGETMQTVFLPANAFTAGENCIAVSIHQSAVSSSDISFDLQLLGNTQYEVTRGAYLQQGSHNGVKVCFLTNASVQATVNFGTALGSLTSSVTESASGTQHFVQINGLQPNTKYYYEVVAPGGYVMQGGPANYFITAPLPGSTQEVNIWATGDCGTGYAEQKAVRDQYLTYMRNLGKHTDVWMLVGDNAYNSGYDSEYQTGFFDPYQDSLLKNVFLYPTPGNHDYANNSTLQNNHNVPYYNIFDLPASGQLGGVASGVEWYYSYNYGNVHFVSLDSYGRESSSLRLYDTLSPQVVWLKNDLAANTMPWTIVYFHHPPYTMGSHNSDTESELVNIRQNLLRILERYKVDLLICGHSHCYERSYLIKGHYGLEPTFNMATHAISNSSAKYDGSVNSCPYVKNAPNHDFGTVYLVSGSAGKVGGSQGAAPHNAMYYSNFSISGATAISIKNNRLDAKFINENGVVQDQFSMLKEASVNDTVQINLLESATLTATYEGSYIWSPGGATTRSITVSPGTNSTYYVNDNVNCLRDTFVVLVTIPTITTTHPGFSSVCRGTSFNLSFTKTGKFFPGNVFTAQLSDPSGSFASPVNIGSITDTAAGIISVTIPALTLPGSDYRLRVVASQMAITGADNGTDIQITLPPVWFLDADNDNYYVGSGVTQCASPGVGYKSSGLLGGNDCNDANNTIWQILTGYIDADGDGHTTGSIQNICSGVTLPTGYIATSAGTDCNDGNSAINPGATEICGNGIDEDCNSGDLACGGTNTWLGITTDWHTAGNWSNNIVPNSCAADVVIPNLNNDPIVSVPVSVGNINLQTGTVLTLHATLSTCGNWSGGTSGYSEVIGQNVILNGNSVQQISGETRFNKLNLNNASEANLQAGTVVEVYDVLELQQSDFNTTSGTLRLLSTSTTHCANINDFGSNGGTLTGPVTAQRFVGGPAGSNQHHVGSPVTANLNQFGAGSSSGYVIPTSNCDETYLIGSSPYGNVFRWDENVPTTCILQGWRVMNSASPADAARGYNVYLNGGSTLNVTGTPNLNTSYGQSGTRGTYNLPTLQSSPNYTFDAGWNLFSNPFPSGYTYTAQAGFNALGFIYVPSGPFSGSYQPLTPGTVLAPFQGIMLQKSAPGGTATYSFTKANRALSGGTVFYQNNNAETLEIEVSGNGFMDKTQLSFNAQSTDQFDSDFDLRKQRSNLGQPTIFTGENTFPYAMNSQPSIAQTSTVDMGLIQGANGTFSFTVNGISSFDPTSYIYLEDKVTGQWQDLRANNSYTFSMTNTENVNRFVLHFTPKAEITAADANCNANGQIVIEQPGSASWQYAVNSSSNTTVGSGTLNQSSPITLSVPAGIYTVTLTDNNGYVVVKQVQVNGSSSITAAGTASTQTAEVNEDITFNSTTANATTINWNFGDGNTATGNTATHSYTEAGVYTVTLTVTNADGCSSTLTQTITVNNKTAVGLSNLTKTNIRIWSRGNRVLVDFSKQKDVMAEIVIYDILGRELSKEPYTKSAVYSKEVLNTEAAYMIVKVTTDNEVLTKKLFVINK